MSQTQPVAIITGAARGIGAATARLFNQNGYHVALVDILPDVKDLATELSAAGPECLGLVCDVADESAVQAAVNQTLAAFGTIDVLVNNAGVYATNNLAAFSDAEYERHFNINVKGLIYCCKAAVAAITSTVSCSHCAAASRIAA